MAGKTVVAIRMKLEEVTASREQFKPYAYKLTGENIFVDVELPVDEIVETGAKITVITPDGLATLMGKVSAAIQKMHNKYTQSL